MIIDKRRAYVRRHVIGGSGIFDTIAKVFGRVASSAAAKKIGEVGSKAIASKFVQTTVKSAANKAANELATHGVNKLADVITQKGKSAMDVVADKILTQDKPVIPAQEILSTITNVPQGKPIRAPLKELSNKVDEIVSRYSKHEQPQSVNTAININKLLSGMGVRKHKKHSNTAIPIQDLVRELNRGAGMKVI